MSSDLGKTNPQKNQGSATVGESSGKIEEAFYQRIAENTPVIIWLSNKNKDLIFLNKTWYKYTGQRQNEGLGSGWLKLVNLKDKANTKKAFYEAHSTRKAFTIECRILNKKGDYRWQVNSGQPQYDDAGNFSGFVGSITDIHNQKIAEEALRFNEERYKTFAEAMPQMAFIADADGNIIYFNKRWYDYVQGIEGTEGWGWKDKQIHHPDDLEKTVEQWTHSLKTGEPYEIEYRLRHHSGAYRWHLGRALPVLNKEGEPTLWFGTNTDIHDQKMSEEELKNANAQLIDKNKKLRRMSKLHKNLLHIIAHDLKGPVGSMQQAIDLMNEIPEDQQDFLMDGLANMVERQGKVLDGLVEIIRAQSPEDINFKEVDLREMVDEIIEEYELVIRQSGGKVEHDFGAASKIAYVHGFAYSILKNLISNAIKYQQDDTPLQLKITGKWENEFLKVCIEDNGIGIDLDQNARSLFQPYERFSDQASGMGIGLYIIKDLIERNGGKISVKSIPGRGTTFTCYFREYK